MDKNQICPETNKSRTKNQILGSCRLLGDGHVGVGSKLAKEVPVAMKGATIAS